MESTRKSPILPKYAYEIEVNLIKNYKSYKDTSYINDAIIYKNL